MRSPVPALATGNRRSLALLRAALRGSTKLHRSQGHFQVTHAVIHGKLEQGVVIELPVLPMETRDFSVHDALLLALLQRVPLRL
jgi:hypothetical protein